MEKKIQVQLNAYPSIPTSLCTPGGTRKTDIHVDLAKLFHHYYLDTYGRTPPNPDPAHFEHVSFLTPDDEFRFVGGGLGASTSARRSKSTELGQAFCRWFLHDHLNITYFAHIGEIINRQRAPSIGGCTVHRISTGDSPDYLCAEDVNRVFLAEAKGRYTSISFKRKEFQEWRNQFDRVQVRDASGTPRAVKGHIVATRFATEEDSQSIRTTLFAEDPSSAGRGPLEEESARSLGAVILGLHYARTAQKLDQPLLAAALRNGLALPQQILVQVVIWEMALDPLKRRFVGGYYAGSDGQAAFAIRDGKIEARRGDPFRLDQARGTFFGLEENIFRQVVSACRSRGTLDSQISRLENVDRIYSAISLLRDGSVVGPAEFFNPVQAATL